MGTRYMTDGEICMFYRQAAWKHEQIQILSELNLCNPSVIKDILYKYGLYDPAHPPARKPSDLKLKSKRESTEEKRKSFMPRGKQKPIVHRRTPEEQERDFRPLYDQGLSDKEIAQRIGNITSSAIATWRYKNKLESNVPPKGSKRNKNKEKTR